MVIILAIKYIIKVNNLNLDIFKYLPKILVTVELYELRVSISIKEHEKDKRASHPSFFIEIAPLFRTQLVNAGYITIF
jgi:hypothetical protein